MNQTHIKQDYLSVYEGKTILITGSVGTVGSELLKQVMAYRPAEIRLFDSYESGLFMQIQTCRSGVRVLPVLGDIRDLGKLQSVMDGVDICFHLAAYKHVYLCEHNPFDSVRTNVIGTQNVLKAALAANVKRFLYTSSDKAVNPTSVMGTSKLLAERVVTAASMQCHNGHNHRVFCTTRFGNVLGSNGSVVEVFKEQIKYGGSVTVTHDQMTRFIMTVQEAARLIIKAVALACGGEVFVTKMPTVRIIDLAEAMIELLAPLYDYQSKEISIQYIGPRPGEKLYEELMSEEETMRAIELKEMFSILPALRESYNGIEYNYPCMVSEKVSKPYISKNEKTMTKEEVITYLLTNNILGEDLTLNVIRNKKKIQPYFEVQYKNL
jgi:FlaA1/EpsC-like NDP-sugar epimerase